MTVRRNHRGWLYVTCENCEGTGKILGTMQHGGCLPDLECPKCCGSGKDFRPELERRNQLP